MRVSMKESVCRLAIIYPALVAGTFLTFFALIVGVASGETVQAVDVSKNKLSLLPAQGKQLVHVSIDPEVDTILLDGQVVSLDKLRRSDQVKLRTYRHADGKKLEVTATRPLPDVSEGIVLRVEPGLQ